MKYKNSKHIIGAFPACNRITFKAIVTEGRMVPVKKGYPVCNLKTFRSLSY